MGLIAVQVGLQGRLYGWFGVAHSCNIAVVWLGSSIDTMVISTPPTVSILAGVEHLTPVMLSSGHYNGLLSEMGPCRRVILRLAPGDCVGIHCQLARLTIATPPSSLGVDS